MNECSILIAAMLRRWVGLGLLSVITVGVLACGH